MTDSCSGFRAAIARTRQWDAILLEIGLLGGAGFSVYHQFQSEPVTASIEFIFLTSRVIPKDIQLYRQMNIAGVISKPFNPVALKSQFFELLPCQDND